jgi:hypothetical protein
MKSVAKSIQSLAVSDVMGRILDRTEDVSDLVDPVLDQWKYDLYARKPGPALLENGVLKPTDLDLACFLSALVDREAVINLPSYESRRPRTVREGEWVVGRSNRHGKIVGLVANKEVLSFSVRIWDMNVVTGGAHTASGKDEIGAWRNFMLVDLDGEWHKGWRSLEFLPSAKENDFLSDKKLWTGNTVFFDNFVHPNRWTSFYGQHYLLLKCLIARLEDENVFHRAENKRLVAAGLRLPDKEERKGSAETAPGESEKVLAFECELDAPWTGEFPTLAKKQSVLDASLARVKERTYTLLPKLRFAARSVELAFRDAGGTAKGAFPSWISGAAWEKGYVQKGKRTAWDRLVLHQNFPGQVGFALRCRTWEKTERVA